MKVDFSVVRLVPLGIEQKIPGVTELFDPFGVEPFPIGNRESVIVGNLLFGEPVRHFVLVILFDVASEGPKVAVISVKARTASLLTAFVEVGVSRAWGGKPFQNQESRKSECSLEAPLENGGIDRGTVKVGPMDFKASVTVL